MGKATGFIEFQRETVPYRDAAARDKAPSRAGIL